MRCRLLALLTVLYLSLDVTNPFVGAVFRFDAEESIEGVSRQHEGFPCEAVDADARLPGLTSAGTRVRVPPARRAGVRPLTEWFVDLRQAHTPASDPTSSPEDH